jgi:hypothetical protein
VLPLFVLDDGIGRTRYGAAANRHAFLLESLVDLDTPLRKLGGARDISEPGLLRRRIRARSSTTRSRWRRSGARRGL